jgi:hypothetical protein
VLVFLELPLDVPWHGEVKCMLFVVPFEVYATKQVTSPVRGMFIFAFHTFDEVVYIFLSLFTPKSSTTRENKIGCVICFHNPGVCLHS